MKIKLEYGWENDIIADIMYCHPDIRKDFYKFIINGQQTRNRGLL